MEDKSVTIIPIKEINILNPRVRNNLVAEGIRQNIRNVGLKRPITVALREDIENGKKYDLVCGQGRLEAYIAAGEQDIPAIIRNISTGDALIMSLVENIARRNNSGLELLQSVRYLKGLGYVDEEIAMKTNLGKDYIKGIIRLLEQGEEFLVNAVEKGRIPLSYAAKIATEEDSSVQAALADAYESGRLSGKKLVTVQRIITRRKHYGKRINLHHPKAAKISAENLIEIYEKSVKEKKLILAQSNYIQQILAYTSGALKQLLEDIHFKNQLKAVGLDDIPNQITKLIER